MKKKILLLLILFISTILLPYNVNAAEVKHFGKTYTTMNLKETLADDSITESFKNYKESSNQITIYLFRGKGCGYCHAFLEFLNSITEEYGKYFKLESYEVWNDSNNQALMQEVGTYLNEPAEGVPYIVIGDKVFGGYTESYNDGIKKAITDLYNTKKKSRYDVFEQMEKNPKKDASDNSTVSSKSTIIWNLVFIAVATIIVISYNSIKFKELELEINKSNNKTEKVEKKESKNNSKKADE